MLRQMEELGCGQARAGYLASLP